MGGGGEWGEGEGEEVEGKRERQRRGSQMFYCEVRGVV